jgi:hypothetical protein
MQNQPCQQQHERPAWQFAAMVPKGSSGPHFSLPFPTATVPYKSTSPYQNGVTFTSPLVSYPSPRDTFSPFTERGTPVMPRSMF